MSLYFHDMGKEYAFTFLVAENTDVLRGDMMCRTLQANLLSKSHILFIFCTQIFRAALPKLETIKISIHMQENGQTNCGKSMQWCATLKQKGINYWINLKISTPSAKNQTKRSRRDRIPFIQNSWKCQLMCSDKSSYSCLGWEWEAETLWYKLQPTLSPKEGWPGSHRLPCRGEAVGREVCCLELGWQSSGV